MNTTNEQWKEIAGFEGLYKISNLGRVMSLDKTGSKCEFIKKLGRDNSTGYLQVELWKNGKQSNKRVHRLVAIAFVDNPHNLPVVNHKDGDKMNAVATNLEWTSYSLNTLHSYNFNLQKIFRGDENHITKIRDADVCTIKNLFLEGKTNKEIASIYSVNPSQISRIRSGKRRSHLTCDDIC